MPYVEIFLPSPYGNRRPSPPPSPLLLYFKGTPLRTLPGRVKPLPLMAIRIKCVCTVVGGEAL